MRKINRLIAFLLALVTASFFCACNASFQLDFTGAGDSESSDGNYTTEDIVVLYTNDIHCAFETDIGFSGLSSFKKLAFEKTPYVTLVDVGDAIQGEVIGTISKGEYITDMMNKTGYDLAVLGNHEFDYGMEQLKYIIGKSNHNYLGCNLTYSGSGENLLSDVKPYQIIEYGETAVAYIGVSTPETLTSSTPTYFMENGEFVYGFTAGNDGKDLYACVQGYIDECLGLGADYVIILSHLGDIEESAPYTSVDLIKNTTGIDAVIDGHAHNTIPSRIERDKDGSAVLLSSTGTKFANIGQLVISSNGYITAGLISDYDEKDTELDNYIASLKVSYEEEMNTVVGYSDITLSCSDSEGIRLVRTRETAIGNLCADAYRYVTGADVALVNGGGIRADIAEGNITYADIIAVHPFGNTMCMVEATGQEILDSLEIASRAARDVYSEDGYAVGEEGSFQSVSGLKYTIDTSIESGVVFDENGMFLEFTGERRVKDVLIIDDNGEYVPLEPDAVYTVASHNYLIKSSGGGITQFSDNELLINEGMSDYQVLITYIVDCLGGNIGEVYSDIEGRITIE